jgi:hypothetical protein
VLSSGGDSGCAERLRSSAEIPDQKTRIDKSECFYQKKNTPSHPDLTEGSQSPTEGRALMPSNDQTQAAPERRPDEMRHEILEILTESGLTPGQGIEGILDRLIHAGPER